MAHYDVPGANPANRDELHAGCWAEHPDGSLVYVLSGEQQRVVYEMFDVSVDPPISYRDAMPIGDFQKAFSWKGGKPQKTRRGTVANEQWVWHDKTPFPWDRIDPALAMGPRPASAQTTLNAAQRVAQSLRLRAERLNPDSLRHLRERTYTGVTTAAAVIKDKMTRALGELRK